MEPLRENKNMNLMNEKLDILRKLDYIKFYGVKLSENYSINSDIIKMKAEYTMHSDIIKYNRGINYMFSLLENSILFYYHFNDLCDTYDKKVNAIKEFISILIKCTLDPEYKTKILNDIKKIINLSFMLCCC
jgi:hypothetical protein